MTALKSEARQAERGRRPVPLVALRISHVAGRDAPPLKAMVNKGRHKELYVSGNQEWKYLRSRS